MMNEEKFYVQAFYQGGMNSFEVTPGDGYFTVAYDGHEIAQIRHQEDWVQSSGVPLPEDTFFSIKQAIEAKYD